MHLGERLTGDCILVCSAVLLALLSCGVFFLTLGPARHSVSFVLLFVADDMCHGRRTAQWYNTSVPTYEWHLVALMSFAGASAVFLLPLIKDSLLFSAYGAQLASHLV